MNSFRLNSRILPIPLGAPPRGAVSSAVPGPPSGAGTPVPAPPVLEAGTSAAVPVPWRVVARSDRGAVEFEHRGTGPLRAVRFALAGGGMLGLTLPRTVYPGERLRVVVRGVHADGAFSAPDAMLVLRWFQPDGTELLWPVAL